MTGRRQLLALAALLFLGVFALRSAVSDPSELVTLLYTLPIAIVAAELGLAWGLGTAGLALLLYGIWDAAWNDGANSVFGYVIRGVVFLAIAGAVGRLADRLRRISADSERFWELSGDLMCAARFDGYFERLNPAWERTLGWTIEELCAQPFLEFVHPDDRDQTVAEAAALTRAGYETVTFENRYRCKDGSYRTLIWNARSVPEEQLIYATARDATQSLQAQEELRRSERFLDSVLESLPLTAFVKDAIQLRFVRFNRAGEQLLGVGRDELLGRTGHDVFSARRAEAEQVSDRAALAADGAVEIAEETIDTAANGARILHTRKIAIRDGHGQPQYLLGISEDITDRALAERDAEAARAEAQHANQAKSEFLSRMSHELRTPLNAVLGFGQLLELDVEGPRERESVGQILKAGRHLLELINEVLDISRIESGTMSISLEAVHLGSVLADALSLVAPLADEAQVRLLASPSDCDVHVLADQQRLKQVLINLLSNAVKYNRSGGSVSVTCRELDGDRIELGVQDSGRGMTAAQMQRLFEPFDRLGAEASEIEGTGLGLSLCKGLMEAMGGTIGAQSEPGVGTTMRIVLACADGPDGAAPAHDDAGETAPAADGPSRAGTTIVYIEDNLSNLRLVERLLARMPEVRLIPAMQAKLGIELIGQHRPDLVLLDLHLPDMHGREVLAQLKRDPATATIPVVILSADATPAQIQRLRGAGAAGFLTKPIDVETLLDLVGNGLPGAGA